MLISPGGQLGHRYVIPMAPRHMVHSSLQVQDGVSFFFKMGLARPVPFLPQGEEGERGGLGRLPDREKEHRTRSIWDKLKSGLNARLGTFSASLVKS